MEGLSAVGACRLCMVEVSGVARLLPACTTPCKRGWPWPPARRNSSPIGRLRSSCCSPSAITSVPGASLRVTASCRPSRKTTHHAHPLPLQLPAAQRRHQPPTLRARPQPLRPVLALRAHLRRDRGRARLDIAGRGINSRLVSELKRPLGEAPQLHQLRQCVRPAQREPWPKRVWCRGDMTKQRTVVSRLTTMREGQ